MCTENVVSNLAYLDVRFQDSEHSKSCINQTLNKDPSFVKVGGFWRLARLVPEGEDVGGVDLQGGGLFSM